MGVLTGTPQSPVPGVGAEGQRSGAGLVAGVPLWVFPGWDVCLPAPCCRGTFPRVFPAPALTDLSAAKRKFADSLNEFKFRCIGDAETDDEICIGESWCSCSHCLSRAGRETHTRDTEGISLLEMPHSSWLNSSKAFPRESLVASWPKSVPAR